MKILYSPTIIAVLIAGALFIETAVARVLPESHDYSERSSFHPLSLPHLSSQKTAGLAVSDGADDQIEIQATRRISIPFGIAPTLFLYNDGEEVLVNGHGGCTANETVSVVITVTQTTGSSAVGQTDEICTGLLQRWHLTATVMAGAELEATEAEACGIAVTHLDGLVTDSFEWCRDVILARPHYYLPLIFVQHEGSG